MRNEPQRLDPNCHQGSLDFGNTEGTPLGSKDKWTQVQVLESVEVVLWAIKEGHLTFVWDTMCRGCGKDVTVDREPSLVSFIPWELEPFEFQSLKMTLDEFNSESNNTVSWLRPVAQRIGSVLTRRKYR